LKHKNIKLFKLGFFQPCWQLGLRFEPVGLYESRQSLGAEPENSDDERVAVCHDDGWQNEDDDQLIPGERDTC